MKGGKAGIRTRWEFRLSGPRPPVEAIWATMLGLAESRVLSECVDRFQRGRIHQNGEHWRDADFAAMWNRLNGDCSIPPKGDNLSGRWCSVHKLTGQCFPALPVAQQRTVGLNLFQSLAAAGEFLFDRLDGRWSRQNVWA
jgi:hypothetical protein